jgi:hypothetical protein
VRANEVAAAVEASTMNVETWKTACRLLELHNRKRYSANDCREKAIALLTTPVNIGLFNSAVERTRSGRRMTLSANGRTIAEEILSTETLKELKKAFDQLDTDGNGLLTLRDWIRDADTSENRDMWEELQKHFDLDHDQQVTYLEFQTKIFTWVLQQEQNFFRRKAGQTSLLAPLINEIHERLNHTVVEKAKQVSKEKKAKSGDCTLM